MFSSLSYRNYRIWFIGATVSNIGQWMARTAQSWLVLVVLTDNSATALGFVNALAFAPSLLLAAWAGTVADRFPKRSILRITQVFLGIDAVILSTLVLTGRVELWHVYLIAVIDGIAVTFDNPARQAFVSEVVPVRELSNAISLNSASFNTARLVGPGLGGVLIALFGTGPVIAVNVAAFASLLVALALMKSSELNPAPLVTGRGKLREGLAYVRNRSDLMTLLACGFAVGGLGFNFNISNAVMAADAFDKGASEYGALGSMMGIGALAAALWSARRGASRLRHILGGMAMYSVFSLVAALSPSFEIFAALQVLIGFGTVTVLVSGNAMLQTRTRPEMRGRVMALWGLTMMGMTPIVSPLVGWLGDSLGPRATVMFGVVGVSVALVIVTFVVMHNDHLRIRLDSSRRLPWLRLERGLTEDFGDRPR